MIKKPTLIATAFCSLFASHAALAKISPEEAARLDKDLSINSASTIVVASDLGMEVLGGKL